MHIFQQEFSLSWGYKDWLPIHKSCWLCLVCQGLSVRCACNAHFISVLDQLTPFCNAVSVNSFPTHAQIASTLLKLCPRPTGLECGQGCHHSTPVSTSLPGGRRGWARPLENLQEAQQPITHHWWCRSPRHSLRTLQYVLRAYLDLSLPIFHLKC